jgi:galactokinase
MRSETLAFAAAFGASSPGKRTVIADAPGRVNLLGEHTDYNQGLVLPTAIPQRTRVELRFREDRRVRALSATLDPPEAAAPEYVLGEEARGRGWLDYIQGVTWALRMRDLTLRGFDLHVTSSIPAGSGLSSSAALLVALLRGLREGLALPLSDLELARLCQRVENDFVGAPVGILDPMACSMCERGTALFLDTKTLKGEPLALPRGLELLVIHSGVKHRHADAGVAAEESGYRVRRAECERAAQLLGVRSLRELGAGEEDLYRINVLHPPLDRRVRHVLTENERVRAAAAVLRSPPAAKEKSLEALGALFAASHRSQREDFAVSVPEVDLLVEIGGSDGDIINRGARLTGGGFGGSVVMLAHAGTAASAAARIAARYARESGQTPVVLVPESAVS